MGIVVFAITVGVGVVVLQKFGGAVASCDPGFGFESNTTSILNYCTNDTNGSDYTAPLNSAWTNTNSLVGDLGTSGLAGWTAAIIALAVGLLFIGALMGKRKY